MTFRAPALLLVAALLVAATVVAVVVPPRRRAAALAAAGLVPVERGRTGRRVGAALVVLAMALLGLALARPSATLSLPHVGGTAVLALDVSNSMAATDADPSRLAEAQRLATAFVDAQPASVTVGVVAFSQGGMEVSQPSDGRAAALAAIQRQTTGGGTSLAQAIASALSSIVGAPVVVPSPDAAAGAGGGGALAGGDGGDATPAPAAAPSLGYHGDATIVVLSDGQDQNPDAALAAAQLAADAGVHVDTVGVGTAAGTTVTVDGFQLATALDSDLLTQIAQTTGGSYLDGAHDDVAAGVDQRLTTAPRPVELTGALAALAVVLLTVAGALRLARTGRLV
ncbi:MAG TPA: VWA domain-containing protein [Cellulomonas sp.]